VYPRNRIQYRFLALPLPAETIATLVSLTEAIESCNALATGSSSAFAFASASVSVHFLSGFLDVSELFVNEDNSAVAG
jgi:hypothetical protein